MSFAAEVGKGGLPMPHNNAENPCASCTDKANRIKELESTLMALASLARSTTRPSGQPELCRVLLDIEGIARAVVCKAK